MKLGIIIIVVIILGYALIPSKATPLYIVSGVSTTEPECDVPAQSFSGITDSTGAVVWQSSFNPPVVPCYLDIQATVNYGGQVSQSMTRIRILPQCQLGQFVGDPIQCYCTGKIVGKKCR